VLPDESARSTSGTGKGTEPDWRVRKRSYGPTY
jgi:hypothetical protein